MTYSHFQHRHNFAVWCAARAVQRGFAAKNPVLRRALEQCGVREFIEKHESADISQDVFDKHHESWCESILHTWDKDNVNGGSYGRAAKLIAIYLKSMIVVRNELNNLSNVAHPPIDDKVLQNISKDKRIEHQNRTGWKKIKWTKLSKSEYKRLVNDFREVLDGQPFWFIEKYWILS